MTAEMLTMDPAPPLSNNNPWIYDQGYNHGCLAYAVAACLNHHIQHRIIVDPEPWIQDGIPVEGFSIEQIIDRIRDRGVRAMAGSIRLDVLEFDIVWIDIENLAYSLGVYGGCLVLIIPARLVSEDTAVGAHSVVCRACDDSEVIIQNSYGHQWGDRGIARLALSSLPNPCPTLVICQLQADVRPPHDASAVDGVHPAVGMADRSVETPDRDGGDDV